MTRIYCNSVGSLFQRMGETRIENNKKRLANSVNPDHV